MNYQQFTIPGENKPQTIEELSSVETTLKDVLPVDKTEFQTGIDERREIIQIQKSIEAARESKINEILYESRKRKIGSLVDRLVFGSSVSSDDGAKQREELWRKQLLEIESEHGGELIQPLADEKHFFHYHDRNEWFWYVRNPKTNAEQSVRYLVDEQKGIFRSLNAAEFELISDSEKENLIAAIKDYHIHVLSGVYNRQDLASQDSLV